MRLAVAFVDVSGSLVWALEQWQTWRVEMSIVVVVSCDEVRGMLVAAREML